MRGDTLNLVIAVVSIVVGAVVSYYFYRLARKERRPVYIVTGNVVVRADRKRDIEVRHRGTEVPMVTRSVVTFWNDGREPIRRSDLLENHPLTIKLPDGADTLEAQVIASTRPQIDFACFPDPFYSDVQFAFNYLNHRDGGAVELLHTSDDPWAVTVDGAIVGVDGPPTLIPLNLSIDPLKRLLPVLWIAVLPGATITQLRGDWIGLALGLFVMLVGGTWATSYVLKRDRRRVPAPLRGSLGPEGPPVLARQRRRTKRRTQAPLPHVDEAGEQQADYDQQDRDRRAERHKEDDR